jgi:hypothetical protein
MVRMTRKTMMGDPRALAGKQVGGSHIISLVMDDV